jgi:hypothetical protein
LSDGITTVLPLVLPLTDLNRRPRMINGRMNWFRPPGLYRNPSKTAAKKPLWINGAFCAGRVGRLLIEVQINAARLQRLDGTQQVK